MTSPANIFALIALVAGLILVALIPPLGGKNETFNFQRAVSVSNGDVMVGTSEVPRGVVAVIGKTMEIIPDGARPPHSFSRDDYQSLANIPLGADNPVAVPPNPIAVLHPLTYLAHAPVLSVGQALGLRPIVLVYLARIAGLLAGVALTYFAIKAIPIHKHALAAIALLPSIVYARSQLDADQITNGLAFLFLALVMREIVADGRLKRRALAGLILSGFVLAQCKSAYLLLPLFSLLIPAARYGSNAKKWMATALIVLPGLVASLAWMLSLKHGYFAGVRYDTYGGSVYPDGQMALILSNPLGFLEVLLRTVFATPLIPVSLFQLIGISAPWLIYPAAILPLFFFGIAAVIICEPVAPQGHLQSAPTRTLAALLIVSSAAIILTLLYLQWTQLSGPLVIGFQGRYLIPVLPLLLLFIPSGGQNRMVLTSSGWIILVGLASAVSTTLTAYTDYWA